MDSFAVAAILIYIRYSINSVNEFFDMAFVTYICLAHMQ